MDYLLAWPFYFWSGLTGLYKLSLHLPWPTRAEWFRWFVFLILGKLVWYILSSKINRKNNRVSENGAAAGVSSLFEHH